MDIATPAIITVTNGRAFSSDSPRQGYRAKVDSDGTVRVWDSVAGHYTTCHALTPAQTRYLRAQAARV